MGNGNNPVSERAAITNDKVVVAKDASLALRFAGELCCNDLLASAVAVGVLV